MAPGGEGVREGYLDAHPLVLRRDGARRGAPGGGLCPPASRPGATAAWVGAARPATMAGGRRPDVRDMGWRSRRRGGSGAAEKVARA